MNLEWQGALDNIFGAILIGAIDITSPNLVAKRETLKKCLPLFKGRFVHNVFQDEYAVLYEVVISMKQFGVCTEDMLDTILEHNQDVILNSTVINFDSVLSTIEGLKEKAADIDKFQVFKSMVMDKFRELSNKYVTFEEYSAATEMYIMLYKQHLMQETINNMSIINLGSHTIKNVNGRWKTYTGVEGAKQYYIDRMKVIESLEEGNISGSITIDENWLQEDLAQGTEEDKLRLVDFGLDEINDKARYIRRTHMIGILGPPKGGKTRTAGFLANRLLEAGYNVAIWALEGTPSEWLGMLTANTVRLDSGVSLGSDSIISNIYEEESHRQLVVSAKTKMAIGENRGRLSFIEGMMYVETMLDVLKDHYENENPYDCIIIDSPVLVLSKTGRGKVERIGEAYTKLKAFISNGLPIPPCCIVPAQLKQKAVDELRNNQDADIDVTAGGESAETIRTPDLTIGVFSTKEERDAGRQRFYCVASRHCAPFGNFYSRAEFGCCYYESDSELNVV